MADTSTAPSFQDYISQVAPEDQSVARDVYFDRYVAPNFSPVEQDLARAAFEQHAVLPEKPGFWSEAGKGFERGLATKGMGLVGSTALAAQATGNRAAIDRSNQMVRQQQRDMQQYQSPYSDYENIHSLGDFGRFAGASIGEMAGNVLPTMGVAALSGPLAPVTAGADIVATTAGNQYAQALQRADDLKALEQIKNGQPVDVRDSYQSIDKGKLAVGTAESAALEAAGYALGPAGRLIFRGKAGLGKTATDLLTQEGPLGSRVGNAALGAARGALGEGTTEFAQEFTDEYGSGNPDWFSKETARQGLKAGLSAALGGGVLGGVGGAVQAPQGTAALRDVGQTYGDQLNSDGLLNEAPPEPTPAEVSQAAKDDALSRIGSLEQAAPDVFETVNDPKNRNLPYVPKLSLSAFTKKVDAAWKAKVPVPSEDELDAAFVQAVEGGYNKDYKAFSNEVRKQKEAEYEAENPRLNSQQLVGLWQDYTELHDNNIRGFQSARNWVDGLYQEQVPPANPGFDANVPTGAMPPVRPDGLPTDVGGGKLFTPTTPNAPAPTQEAMRNDTTYEGLPANVGGGKLFTPAAPAATVPPVSAPAGSTAPVAPAVTPTAPVKPTKPKDRRMVDPESDDLLMAIRKLGGIDGTLESDWNDGTLNTHSKDRIVGVGNVVRNKNGGLSLDELAQKLYGYGYLKAHDAGELSEKLWAATSGSKHYSDQKQGEAVAAADNGTDLWIERMDQAGSEDDVVELARSAGADPRFQARFKADPAFADAWTKAMDHALEQSAPLESRQAEAPPPSQDLMPAPTASNKFATIDAQDEATRQDMLEWYGQRLQDDGDLNQVLDRLPDPMTQDPYSGNVSRVAWAVSKNPAASEATQARAKKIYEQATRGLDSNPDLMPTASADDQATADQLALEARQKDTQRRLNATDAPRGGGLFDMDNRQDDIFSTPSGEPNANNPQPSVAADVPAIAGEVSGTGSGERGAVGGGAGVAGRPVDGGTGAVSGPQSEGQGGAGAAGDTNQSASTLTDEKPATPDEVNAVRGVLSTEHPSDRADLPAEETEALRSQAKAAYTSGDLEIPQYMAVLDFMARREWDAVRAVLSKVGYAPAVTDKGSLSKVKRAVARGGADIKRLINMLGGQMYKAQLADVTVKEMVQNSFDAVKAAVNKKLEKQGRIDVAIDPNNRLVVIRDNGQGMTPAIIQKAFLTLAGTDKSGLNAGEASGGFGMAKAAFLTGSDQIWVRTAREGKQTTFTFKGANFFDEDIPMDTQEVDKKAHGTTIIVKIPRATKVDGQDYEQWFPYDQSSVEFFNHPMLGKELEVNFGRFNLWEGDPASLLDPDSMESRDLTAAMAAQPLGKNFDLSGYAAPIKVTFPWGTADVHFGKKRKTGGWMNRPRHAILSAGIFQFNYTFAEGFEQLPYDIIVNAKPTVAPDSPSYPFNLKREGWKDVIEKDVEALNKYLGNIASGKSAEETVETFKTIRALPRVNVEASSLGNDVDITEFILQKPKPAISDEEAKAALNDAEASMPAEISVGNGLVTTVDKDGQQKTLVNLEQEKKDKYASRMEADTPVPKASDFLLDVGIDDKLPIFHNNTGADYSAMSPQADVMFAEIGSLMLSMKDKIASLKRRGYESLTGDQPYFVGVSIDKQYHGVNLVVPFRASLLNPLAIKGKTLPSIVVGLYDTLLHEFAHTRERNHDAGFIGEMSSLGSALASDGFDLEMRVNLTRVLKKHQQVFNELRDKYEDSTTTNLSKSLHEGEKDAGLASRRDADGADGGPAYDSRNPSDTVDGRGGYQNGGPVRGNAGGGQQGEERRGSDPARKNALAEMPQALVNATRDVFTDKAPDAVMNLLLNPIQVANLNPQYPSAMRYADATQAMQVDMLKNQHRIAGLVDGMARLPKVSKDLLMDLMTKSTLLGVNPDIGDKESVMQSIGGREVEVSNAHLASRSNGAKQHEAMRQAYMALPKDARDLYVQIRNHFADSWNRRIETIRTLAEESDISPEVRAKLNKDMDELASKIVGPYFPLMREGRFAVIWKSQALLEAEDKGDAAQVDKLKESASDYWVRFTDSQSEAETLSTKRPEGLKDDAQGYYNLRTSQSRDAEGASSAFVSNLEEALAKRISDGTVRDEVLQSIRGVFLSTLPELSVMKRTLMRRGVAGVNSDDMLQSIARAGIADAHYLARISHMSDIVESLSDLRKEDAKALRGKKPGEVGTPQGGIGRVYNSMMKSFQADMIRPESGGWNGVANKLTSLSYIHGLAMDTGNLIANVLQPQMTSFPLMGAKYGFGKAEKAMATALVDTVQMVGTNLRARNLDVTKLTDDPGEQEAMGSMMDLAELSQSRELAMIGRGQSRKFNALLEVLAGPSHYVETVSRLSTMLAAYRLEAARISSDPNYANRTAAERQAMAVRYASRLSGESLGNYTAGGVPNALRGNHQASTRLVLQFKRYAITMLYLYAKAARDAVKGNREAQKTLGALLALQFTIAGGLSGLPTALPAKLIAALFPGEDDDESEERKLDRLAEAMAGGNPTVATWLRKGPLSSMTGIDVNRKMGLGDLLALNMSYLGEGATQGIAEARRMVSGNPQVAARNPSDKWSAGEVIENLMPGVSILTTLGRGLSQISDGKLADGILTMVPKSAFTSFYTEQVQERTKKEGLVSRTGGIPKLKPEAYSEWDITMKSLGLPITLESEAWSKSTAWDEIKQPKADRRADILERYVAAKRRQDKSAIADMEQEIEAFNASLPEAARRSMKIDRSDMLSRVHSAKKAEKQMAITGGVRASKKERKWAQSVTKPYNQ